MNYQINDTVLYHAGVCKITGITEKKMGGNCAEYYVLKPINDDKTVSYVPLKNKLATAKMRRILSSSEIYALIKAMPDEHTIWIENETIRREKYKEILSCGERAAMVRLIKTLYLRQQDQKEQNKKLHVADERLMKEAERMLYDEFAYVLKVKPDQVLPFILEHIELEEH